MSIQSLIAKSNWIPLNKILANRLGLYEALIIAELSNEYEFHRMNGKLVADGWFYCTVAKLETETTLSKKQQTRPITRLETMGVLELKLMGVPAKRHFKINEEKLGHLLLDQKGPTESSNSLFPDEPLSTNKQSRKGPRINKNLDKSLYEKMMSLYFNWYKDKDGLGMGIEPKIDGRDGAALKRLIKYFTTVKTGTKNEEDVFKLILDNWNRLEDFYKQKTRISEIENNIQAIIFQIKNGSKKTKAAVGDKLKEYLEQK